MYVPCAATLTKTIHERQRTYNVILMRVCVTIVAVEKQYHVFSMCL
jgi:hypothetical protein